jgi:hypothetical protein
MPGERQVWTIHIARHNGLGFISPYDRRLRAGIIRARTQLRPRRCNVECGGGPQVPPYRVPSSWQKLFATSGREFPTSTTAAGPYALRAGRTFRRNLATNSTIGGMHSYGRPSECTRTKRMARGSSQASVRRGRQLRNLGGSDWTGMASP